MSLISSLFLQASILASASLLNVHAEEINLLPKYGSLPKTAAEQAADEKFLEAMDRHYQGDRKKASEEAAARGWRAFRVRYFDEAMKRFNQAWLLDPSNPRALWGMGSVQGATGKFEQALQLFNEAAPGLENDIDFSVDHARALAWAAVRDRDEAAVKQALARFASIYAKAPQHTLNLQNWAITLFATDDLAGAWEKVQLAEATPDRSVLDSRFLADLQAAMPRPSSGTSGQKPAPAPARSGAQDAPEIASKSPELWSSHQRLQVTADVCVAQAYATLTSLGYAKVLRNGYFSYGERDGHRAAIKCVDMPPGSFVYFAVAGPARKATEALRNDIARKMLGEGR